MERASKIFFHAFLAFLGVFILVNWVTWTRVTETLLTEHHGFAGDLTRLGYIWGSTYPRHNEDDLPRRHVENADWRGEPIDILTVGVSNSNGMGGGRNRFYQDYLATRFGASVMNIQLYKNKPPLDTLWIALNSGYLDRVKPRIVWLETGQRVTVPWYGHPIDPSQSFPLEDVEAFYREARYVNPLPPVKFINSGNLKFLANLLLYRLSDRAFASQVYMRELDRPMFSVPAERRLLFFHEDLKYLPLATPGSVRTVNENVNALADRLAGRGMKLVFMLSVDKYDLYEPLIANNPYPKARLFEEMAGLDHRFTYADTKKIWQPMVMSGEKDVFYADDTHWSWKASERLAASVALPD